MSDLIDLMSIPQDKANHFIWSFVINFLSLLILLFFNYVTGMELSSTVLVGQAVIFTITVGFIKELIDNATNDNYLSLGDMVANILGASSFVGVFKLGTALA